MKQCPTIPKKRGMKFISLMCALPLIGCGAIDTKDVDWEHGAKKAYIERIYSPVDLQGHNPLSCLNSIPEAARLSGQYVEVSYWNGRIKKWKPAKVSDDLHVQVGDEVELYPTECSINTIPVIRKILRPSVSQGA